MKRKRGTKGKNHKLEGSVVDLELFFPGFGSDFSIWIRIRILFWILHEFFVELFNINFTFEPSVVVMSTIPKRKYKRSDIEANYRNETKTF